MNKINGGCDFMNINTSAAKKSLPKDSAINYFDLIEVVEKESVDIVGDYIRLSN